MDHGGHYAFALHEFREAARLDPTSAKFADCGARMFYHLGATDDSIGWYEHANDLDPSNAVWPTTFSTA